MKLKDKLLNAFNDNKDVINYAKHLVNANIIRFLPEEDDTLDSLAKDVKELVSFVKLKVNCDLNSEYVSLDITVLTIDGYKINVNMDVLYEDIFRIKNTEHLEDDFVKKIFSAAVANNIVELESCNTNDDELLDLKAQLNNVKKLFSEASKDHEYIATIVFKGDTGEIVIKDIRAKN